MKTIINSYAFATIFHVIGMCFTVPELHRKTCIKLIKPENNGDTECVIAKHTSE